MDNFFNEYGPTVLYIEFIAFVIGYIFAGFAVAFTLYRLQSSPFGEAGRKIGIIEAIVCGIFWPVVAIKSRLG